MTLKYQTGEAIQKGDHIRYHGETGVVEFVAESISGDAALDWYVQEFGGGAMVVVAAFGRVFISDLDNDEDLELIARG
jgi:hypothetical protein